MGQARRRGSFEHRKEEAILRKKNVLRQRDHITLSTPED